MADTEMTQGITRGRPHVYALDITPPKAYVTLGPVSFGQRAPTPPEPMTPQQLDGLIGQSGIVEMWKGGKLSTFIDARDIKHVLEHKGIKPSSDAIMKEISDYIDDTIAQEKAGKSSKGFRGFEKESQPNLRFNYGEIQPDNNWRRDSHGRGYLTETTTKEADYSALLASAKPVQPEHNASLPFAQGDKQRGV